MKIANIAEKNEKPAHSSYPHKVTKKAYYCLYLRYL